MTLASLLTKPPAEMRVPISDEHRREIFMLAQDLLGSRFTSGNIVGITLLGLATDRADLREQLERLATDEQAWTDRGVVSPFSINLGQRIIQNQLKKSPK